MSKSAYIIINRLIVVVIASSAVFSFQASLGKHARTNIEKIQSISKGNGVSKPGNAFPMLLRSNILSQTNGIHRDIFKRHTDSLQTPLITSIVSTHYIQTDELAKLLSDPKLGLLSYRGYITAALKNQILVLHDTKNRIKHIKSLIRQLDHPEPQVLIKAQIVDIDSHYVQSLGALLQSKAPAHANPYRQEEHTSAMNHVSLPLFKFKDGSHLNLVLSALENQGHARLISSPELLTLNKHTASIQSGQEIPYQESTSSGATSISFKKAVLKLQVTPDILPHHRIRLHLIVNQDKVSSLSVLGVPAIETQELNTTAIVESNQTLVLGGIFVQIRTHQRSGIPGLQKLPILGALFRQKEKSTQRRELLIFVTPVIVKP